MPSKERNEAVAFLRRAGNGCHFSVKRRGKGGKTKLADQSGCLADFDLPSEGKKKKSRA